MQNDNQGTLQRGEDQNSSIAKVRVGDDATVIVLGIHPNESLCCRKDCNMLVEDDNGVIVCGYERVKDITDCQTRSLVIEYQCILDNHAEDEWYLWEEDFKVIDSNGFIHEGSVICEDIIYPMNSVENGFILYKGTRANIVISYPDFPKDGIISSILIAKSHYEKGTINLSDGNPADAIPELTEDNPEKKTGPVFNPRNPEDLFERMDKLEAAVRELQDKLRILSGGKVTMESVVETPSSAVPAPKVVVKSVSELTALNPDDFREVVISLLHGQGFKNIETKSDPDVGFSSMIGSRYGTTYAIYAIPCIQEVEISRESVQRLLGFQKLHERSKALFISSGRFSREAETLARLNDVELIDVSRLAMMLSLKDDSFAYKPL